MARVGWMVLVAGIAAGCGAVLDAPWTARASLTNDGGAPLATFNVVPTDVAVAGISSGAYMAVQLHVAYSATFTKGAAIFAGGPFYCAQDSISTAEMACMNTYNSIDLSSLESTTDSWAASGDVDPTSNLSGAQVWMWSGTNDSTVKQAVMDSLQSYYQHYGASVTYDNTSNSGHAWISPDATNSCSVSQSPYVNDCSIDAEQEFLSQFWGTLAAKNTGALQGSFVPFDQNEFFDDGNAPAHSMADTGYLYVPPSCATNQSCHLVVALHGCQQYYGTVGDTFMRESGLGEWADTNSMLVLYPQTTTSSSNSSGCWDWWGYDDANYAKKSGRQMLAIKRMVDRITGVTAPTTSSSSSSGSTGATSSTATGSTGGTTGGYCQIFTDNNYNQVQAGRAYQGSGGTCPSGHACAVGSNDDMGLYNTFATTTLVESPQGYYFIGTSCPSTSGSTSGSSGSTSSTAGSSSTSSTSSSTTTGTTGGSSTATSSTTTTGATSSSSTSSAAGSTSGTSSPSGGCASADGASWLAFLALGLLRRRR